VLGVSNDNAALDKNSKHHINVISSIDSGSSNN
jgi:hypothetical protein